MATRREFIGSTAGAAALGAFLPADLAALELAHHEPVADEAWDLAWPGKLKGKHKAVFDVPEIESGYGVWRAAAWGNQYKQVLKAKATDISTVVVIRHNAIILALSDAFWEKYNIGKTKSVMHPITNEPITRNPSLMGEKDGIPAPWNQLGLTSHLARGSVVLACNLALRDCVELIQKQTGANEETARKEAIASLVPGVILQPSGVFAAVRAQEAGCAYVRAS